MRSTELGCFRSHSWCLWKALDDKGCVDTLATLVDLNKLFDWVLEIAPKPLTAGLTRINQAFCCAWHCLEEALDVQVKPKAHGLELYPTHNSREHTETLYLSSPPHHTAQQHMITQELSQTGMTVMDRYWQLARVSNQQLLQSPCLGSGGRRYTKFC
jgi:hypothetical protein